MLTFHFWILWFLCDSLIGFMHLIISLFSILYLGFLSWVVRWCARGDVLLDSLFGSSRGRILINSCVVLFKYSLDAPGHSKRRPSFDVRSITWPSNWIWLAEIVRWANSNLEAQPFNVIWDESAPLPIPHPKKAINTPPDANKIHREKKPGHKPTTNR